MISVYIEYRYIYLYIYFKYMSLYIPTGTYPSEICQFFSKNNESKSLSMFV